MGNAGSTLNEEINGLKQKVRELQNEREKFDNQNMTLQKHNNDLERKIISLKQKSRELEDESSNYQSALGVATNLKMSDGDSNHNVQLNEDILSLQDKIEEYVTNLTKSKVDVKIEEIIKLLPLYECQIKIDSNKPDKIFIKAILQRHVLETIFGFAKDYFSRTGKDDYLESDVVRKTDELYNLMKTFADTRDGNDEITKVTPIKLRQLIYTALGMRGLGYSIDDFKESLNNSMNQYRVIKDPKTRKRVDESAEIIIRQVFRIFYFRLKVQEPEAQYRWFKRGDKVNLTTMKASWDDDEIDDLIVELCIFPFIGQFTDSNQKVFTPAKVFTSNGNYVEDENKLHEEKNEEDQQNDKHLVNNEEKNEEEQRNEKHLVNNEEKNEEEQRDEKHLVNNEEKNEEEQRDEKHLVNNEGKSEEEQRDEKHLVNNEEKNEVEQRDEKHLVNNEGKNEEEQRDEKHLVNNEGKSEEEQRDEKHFVNNEEKNEEEQRIETCNEEAKPVETPIEK